MSEFLMVKRDLLERWVKNTDFFEGLKGVSMHDINEAKKEEENITEELRAVLAQEAGPTKLNIESAAKVLANCMDYPWEHMPENGRSLMRKHAISVIDSALNTSSSEK